MCRGLGRRRVLLLVGILDVVGVVVFVVRLRPGVVVMWLLVVCHGRRGRERERKAGVGCRAFVRDKLNHSTAADTRSFSDAFVT